MVHHVVAGVNTGSAGDAFQLQAVADINAGRADLHAHGAINAETERIRVFAILFLQATARFATLRVIGDDERVLVEHRPLKAGVGTDIFAELLTHDARLQITKTAVKRDPEIRFHVRMQGEKFRNQLAYRHEITDKANPGAHRHQYPQRIFQHALAPFLAAPRLARQFQLLGAVALDFLLNPEKNLGINRVRTGITTPDTAKQGGGKKEQQREPQQDKRQQNKNPAARYSGQKYRNGGAASRKKSPGDRSTERTAVHGKYRAAPRALSCADWRSAPSPGAAGF